MSSVQPFIQIDNVDYGQAQSQFERIIAWGQQTESPLGFFASFFRHLSREIQAESDWGRFENKEEIKALNLALSNAYFQVFFHYVKKEPMAGVWQQTFSAASEGRFTVFQHILMGTTALLRYEMPLAVCRLFKGQNIAFFQEDFQAFQLLAVDKVYQLQQSLAKRSTAFRMVNVLGNTEGEILKGLSGQTELMSIWLTTSQLSDADLDQYANLTRQADEQAMSLISSLYQSSGKLGRKLFSRVSRWENQSVSSLIKEVDKEN